MSNFGIFPADTWTMAERHSANGHVVIRHRTSVPDKADFERFSTLILAGWTFDPHMVTGKPAADVLAEMDAFEKFVTELTDREGDWASLFAVVTSPGLSEFRFFTPSAGLFHEKYAEKMTQWKHLPLQFASFDDPHWKGMTELSSKTGNGR